MSRPDIIFIPPAEKISGKKVFIAFMGKEAESKAMEIALQLRTAGIPAEMDYEEKSLKSQLRRADKLASTHVIVIGEDEIKNNRVQLKNFLKKSQEEVPWDRLISVIESE